MARRRRRAAEDVTLVKITTAFGDLYARLFTAQCPQTVAAFLRLARKHFYHGTEFVHSDRGSILLLPSADRDGDGRGERSPHPPGVGSLVDYGRRLGLVTRTPPTDVHDLTVFGQVFHGTDTLLLLRGGIRVDAIQQVTEVEVLPGITETLEIEELPDGLDFSPAPPARILVFSSPQGRAHVLVYPEEGSGRSLVTQVWGGRVRWTRPLEVILPDADSAEAQFFVADTGVSAAWRLLGDRVVLLQADGSLGESADFNGLARGLWAADGMDLVVETRRGDERALHRHRLGTDRWERVHEATRSGWLKLEVSPDLHWAVSVALEAGRQETLLSLRVHDLPRQTERTCTRYPMATLMGHAGPWPDLFSHVGVNEDGRIGLVLAWPDGVGTEARCLVFGVDGALQAQMVLRLPPHLGPADLLYRMESTFHLLSYPNAEDGRDVCLLFSFSGDRHVPMDLRDLDMLDAIPFYDAAEARFVLVTTEREHDRRRVHVRHVPAARWIDGLTQAPESVEASAEDAEGRQKLGLTGRGTPAGQEDVGSGSEKYSREDVKRMLRQRYIRGELSRQQYRSEMAALGIVFRGYGRFSPLTSGQTAETRVQSASVDSSHRGGSDPLTRKTIAIGDLHGDYHRMVRLLIEEQCVLPDTLDPNPEANNLDLIFIGDFVDWRGEPLEGDADDWVAGSQRIVNLVLKLHNSYEALRAEDPAFQSYVYPILGNHDEMMLEAPRIFSILRESDIELITSSSNQYSQLRKNLQGMGLTPEHIEIVLRFLNWYLQGGNVTIQGFGSLRDWFDAMDGELGQFLREKLRLGVVVNHRLYAHSMPDITDFWRPITDIPTLAPELRDKAKEAYIWGRKLWGFDYISGTRTRPFSQKEVEEFLSKCAVQGLVVGHTPMSCPDPYYAFEGKVINIDLHGVPGSKAFIEFYEPTADDVVPAPFVCARNVPPDGQKRLPRLQEKDETTSIDVKEEVTIDNEAGAEPPLEPSDTAVEIATSGAAADKSEAPAENGAIAAEKEKEKQEEVAELSSESGDIVIL